MKLTRSLSEFTGRTKLPDFTLIHCEYVADILKIYIEKFGAEFFIV